MKIFGLVILNKIYNNLLSFGQNVCYSFVIYNSVFVVVVGRIVLLLFDVFYFILFFYKIVKYIIGINLSGIEIWKILCKIIIIIDVKGLLVINV